MRIGIDAHVLGKGIGGVERYVDMLVQLLPQAAPEHEYLIFASRDAAEKIRPSGNVKICVPALSDPLAQRSVLLPVLARRHRLDVLQVQRIAPLLPGCKIVLTVHDLLPLVCPADHPGLKNMLIRLLTPPSVRSACRILTVSRTMAASIAGHFRLAPEKVTAVYNGVDHDLFNARAPREDALLLERFGITQPFILYVGALMPRKNLLVLLQAFKLLYERLGGGAELVLAGMTRSAGYERSLVDLAENLGIAGAVRRTGFISDQDCVRLLHAARLFAAPSRGEGFDLPPLEAMACGVPVVCSDIEVHRELFNDAAAFFATDSAENCAAALHLIWENDDMRASLQHQGSARAARFTWENTACKLAEIYRGIAADLTR